MKKLIILSAALLLTVSLQAAVTNIIEVEIDAANLSIQPTPDDLWQLPGTVDTIMKGGPHGVVPDGTLSLRDSRSIGDFGDPAHGFNNGYFLFTDGISPTNDTIINVDFDSPKTVEEVHIFANWGDNRQFAYIEVWGSTTGTNEADYTKIGTALSGEFNETNDPPNQAYFRLGRLYDDADGVLANNITSLKLIQKNVGYGIGVGYGVMLPPGTVSPGGVSGSAHMEIDIIGIPEPATLLVSGLLLGLAFLRRN